MNKKVLSALLFSALFAGTGTFTSCIDNDEPEGISEIRTATAELIRAKAAVEQAKVQSVAAEAALAQANAKIAEAQAAYEQAKADKVKAETEIALATSEVEIAMLKVELAEAEAAMELAAKQQEVCMKNIETALLNAEIAYLEAESNLALLDATMTQAEATKVATLKSALAAAKSTLSEKEDALYEANKTLYLAMLDKEGDNSEAVFKLNLSLAEKALVAAQAEEAEAKALAEKDVEATDWEKEAEELRAKAKNLEGAVLDSLNIEYEKIAANNKKEYDAVLEAANARTEAANGDYPVSKYENKTIADNAAVKSLIQVAMGGYSDGVFSYGTDDETFTLTTSVVNDVMKVDATGADVKMAMVENWIEKLGDITIDANDAAASQLLLTGAQTAVANAQTAYEAAVADWTIAKNAYVDGTFVTVPTTAYQAVVNAYNTNVEALAAAITAYNAKYKELYDAGAAAAKDEYLLLEKHSKFSTASKTKLANAPYNMTDAEDRIEAINLLAGTNYTSAITQIEALYAAPATVTDATVKAQYTAGLAAVHAQLNIDMQQYALDNATDIAAEEVAGGTAEVQKAINTDGKTDKALTAAKKVVTDAAAKLTAAVDKAGSYAALEKAIEDYAGLALVPYAQVLTDDADTATAGMTANATYATKTAGVSADYPSVYEIKTNVITDEEFTAATETKKGTAAQIENAWRKASENAFGYNDRVIALTDLTNLKAGDTTSAAYKLNKAQEDLKELNEKIAASETLTALIAELTTQKAVLQGEIDAAKKAVEDAEAAYAAKKKAYNALFEDVEDAQEEAKHLAATYNRIANELETAVNNYYNGLDFKYEDMNGVTQDVTAGNAEELAEWFDNWYVVAQKKTIEAQGDVLEAQVDLKKYQEGKYDAVALATRNVEKAQAAYDEAKAEYDAALDALNAVLALIAAE